MPNQQKLFDKGQAGAIEQDTTTVFSKFEREVIGVIKKSHGNVSSKGQKEIEDILDKYASKVKE